MKLIHNNSTIECDSAEIISRKIIPSAFIQLNNIGKCFSYKCSMNSEATIKKEVSPKIRKVNENSFLDLDSKLECDKLFVAVKKIKPYKFNKINHTGRHKAQTFTTKEFTYATITLQLSNIPLLVPERKIKFIEESSL